MTIGLLKLNLVVGISLTKPKSNGQTVVKKPAWSKISQDDILNYSLKNVDWNYSCEEISSDMMYNELMEKLNCISDIVPLGVIHKIEYASLSHEYVSRT